MTIVKATSPTLMTLSELFSYSRGAFASLELYYQESLVNFLMVNLDSLKLEGAPVVHSTLNSREMITQAQINRIWGRLEMKVFLARQYDSLKDIIDTWIIENEHHPIGDVNVVENIAKFTLEVPLVLIK